MLHYVVVSHFHWDREWYRTFEAYRARLADAVDRVLELLGDDPGYCFVLDGQSVVLEDYLAVRPAQRAALVEGVRSGRLSVGPWYVQPDMLLPCGEALVRNLLRGRRAVDEFGPVSRIAYVPDSFGHPAQSPQLFAGFGLDHFVYWRGNGDEIDRLGQLYWWIAPDGSAVTATLLRDGYFNAACLPNDAREAAERLCEALGSGADRDGVILLMNGFDHMLPDSHTGAFATALAELTGATVERGLLDRGIGSRAATHTFCGDLLGARLANLLPGVWSARMPLKQRNRRCETLLIGWLEPWTALGRLLGAPDERPALDLAWRKVLHNQAHDSICGCSLDAVAERVASRFADAEGLAVHSLDRLLERLAGHGVERRTPDTIEQEIVVFNPSPHPRSDVVRVALEPYPTLHLPVGSPRFPPLLLAAIESPGFAIDGRPVRVVASDDPTRTRWLPGQDALDVEFVASDVPAFGCRRFALTPAARTVETVDDGREIAAGTVRVRVDADNGTLSVWFGDRRLDGLLAVEDLGDCGDTYDFDPLDDDPGARLQSVTWQRRRHQAGLAHLTITRVFAVPQALDDDRLQRSASTVPLTLVSEVRVAPGVERVDVRLRIENTARDHRLRLLCPTGAPAAEYTAATTFDVARRPTGTPDDTRWLHPAPTTFPHQGWVSANDLTVVAPGLPEAEVRTDGTIAITLLRAVGWIARFDVRRRPVPAGPLMPVAGAQVLGDLTAEIALLPGCDPRRAADAELGLRAVLGSAMALLPPGVSLLALEPRTLLLSTVKPAESGDGIVVRVLNPSDAECDAALQVGIRLVGAYAVQLDETPVEQAVRLDGGTVHFPVPARALRSVLLVPAAAA